MDVTIYVIFKVQFDFALEVWFSISFDHIVETPIVNKILFFIVNRLWK